MRIQHNIPAMSAYRNYTNNTSALSKNLEKLSSGYKINRAGDDAAGLAISEKMRAQISGLEQAQSNAKSGINLVQTAEGALTEVHDMLNRMVTLAEQSANGTYDDGVDRVQLQKEVDQLRDEIDRIADSSNFNGIKLLDGSLSDSAAPTKIEISGVASTKSAGVKGVYENSTAFTASTSTTCLQAMVDGDKFSYTVSLDNGLSYTVNLTLDKHGYPDVMSSAHTDHWKYVAADGTEYPAANEGGNGVNISAITEGVVEQLNKTDLAEMYNITKSADGKIKLEALEEGTDTPRVASFDYRMTYGKDVYNTENTALGVSETKALDGGFEIEADKIVEYNGTNADKAIFTINGHKFVLLADDQDASKTGDDEINPNGSYLRAAQALGSDVTILVGGAGGLKDGGSSAAPDGNPTGDTNADAANSNFQQNIKKIAEVTGLTVTGSIAEAGGNTGVDVNKGIRLSIGEGTTDKSLTLQIGDTADDFNQLKVAIKDMHAKAMGIGDIDISKQDGAKKAMSAIKNAINYVSDVRGTLGATQNRLDHTINNLSVMQENIQDAESIIRDVDVAKEMMEYTKNNILVQSAQAMLAQANQLPQGVLQLLQ